MWSNFCCNRNYNRNFQLCLFLIFASSFINRYPLYSVLLRKSNILQLQMLNYHLCQAQKIIKTSKLNITENFCYNFCYNRNWTRRIGLTAKKKEKKIKTTKINIIEKFCYNFFYNKNWSR